MSPFGTAWSGSRLSLLRGESHLRQSLAVLLAFAVAVSVLFIAAPSPVSAAGETVKFAAFGDYGWSGEPHEQSVADIVDGASVDLIITTGDNTYGSATPVSPAVSTIDYNIGKSYSNYIGNYIGGYGSTATTNQFFPAPGNHDFNDGGGIAAYLAYFDLPGAGIQSSGTSGSELYYDFVEGPVHFFAIDSQSATATASANAQKTWLQTQLAASTSQWNVVYFHHPAYTSPNSVHGESAYMQWPFEAWGADAVLAGHVHAYERILRDDDSDGTDMVYITTGSGGKSLYTYSGTTTGSAAQYDDDYGTVIATASDTELTFEFFSIADAGASAVDSYTLEAPESGWVAYNDTAYVDGQIDTNITTFTSPAGTHGSLVSTGELIDYSDGSGTGVTLTITGGNYTTSSHADDGDSAMVGDAAAVFGGKVDPQGILSYANDDLVFEFTGLDPAETYSVVHYANRANGYGWTRAALATISGAVSWTNNSTPGVDDLSANVIRGTSDESTRYSADEQTPGNVLGWVVRFDDIVPSAGGSFTLTMSEDTTGTDTNGRYSNAIALAEGAAGLSTPAVPPGLAVDVVSDTELSVTWSPVGNADSYDLAIDGAVGSPVTGATSPYAASGLTPDVEVCYQVRAVNAFGASDWSGSVCGTPTDTVRVEVSVGASSDDAEEDVADGAMSLTSSDLEMVEESELQLVGLRFASVEVPPGATIVGAHIEFVADEGNGEATSLTIAGQGADDPATFASTAYDISSRTQTAESVVWVPDVWVAGEVHQTPDLSQVLQEIVDRSGWSMGNSMAFVIEGSGKRVAVSHDADPPFTAADAPVLVLDYVLAPPLEDWVAYNDMNTLAGAANPTNVTDYEYDETGALVDYETGAVLPVSVVASTTTPGGPDQYDDGGPVTNPASDASEAFGGIVDLTGADQLVSGESSTLTFTGLDPSKLYVVTLSANRDNPAYAGNRYAQVSIAGADSATADSSSGVVVNSATSVSFSIGDNSANGYVARWVSIDPGSDGEFTITSVWDQSQGTVPAATSPNTKGYAMAAFKLETYSAVDTTNPLVNIVTPADGATYEQGEVVTVDFACSDLDSRIAFCDGTADDESALDTSVLGTGIEFTVTAGNGAGLPTTVTHTYDVVEPVTSGTVDVRVNANTDDAEEDSGDGGVSLGSSDLELVRDSNDTAADPQLVGMRFVGVDVPQGATITNAYLEFTVDSIVANEATRLTISGEDADNPLTFTTTVDDISDRTQTAAEALWIPGDWTTVGATHQSSDISRVVQEIVDRGGWSSGNDMAFIIEGSGRRRAVSHDEDAGAAPLLHVEYVTVPVPLVTSFQQNADGYVGTVDTYLDEGAANVDNSANPTLVVDVLQGATTPRLKQALVRFEDLFGSGAGQIPAGSVIQSAELEVEVSNASVSGASLHRMLQTWSDEDTWNTWGSGIQADGTEAAIAADSGSHGSAVGASSIDVTADVQAWSDDPAANHGWAWLQTVDDSWQFDSAETGNPPILTVKYFPPPPSSASLVLSGDNVMDVFVNGLLVGSSSNWMEATSLAADVAAGDVVGVHVTDLDWSGGLLAQIEWDGSTFVSDTSWMVTASTPAAGWNDRGFDDSGWDAATSYGSWGAAPWMDWMSGFPSPTSAQWIWTDQNDNTGDDDVYFRWVVGTPSAADDTIVASADNAMDLYVNGSLVASSVDWMSATKVFDSLSDGDVIGVHATDSPGGWFGGFIGQIDWDGQTAVSDSSWKVTSSVPASDWADQGFNDSGWDDATAYGPLGVSPWMDWMSGFPAPSSAQWIWSADNINDDDVYFRKVLGTPSASSDSIVASADNEMDLYVNGLLVGSSSDWLSATSVFADLSVGDVVAVAARDFTGLGDGDVAGFIAQVEWDGNTAVSDASWKVTAATPASDWADQGFDDSGWDAASSYGPLGGAPWMDWMTGFPSPTTAQWIWSADNTGDDSVWLRFEIPSGP